MIELPEQPEDVRGRPAAITLVVTVLAIVASVVVVWLMRPARSGAVSGPVIAPDFDAPTVFEERRAAQATAMDTWTWADPAHTRVRMPVGLAIDRYLGRSEGGPP